MPNKCFRLVHEPHNSQRKSYYQIHLAAISMRNFWDFYFDGDIIIYHNATLDHYFLIEILSNWSWNSDDVETAWSVEISLLSQRVSGMFSEPFFIFADIHQSQP